MMNTIKAKDFMPLTDHQTGIKIKNTILDKLSKTKDSVIIDFDGVEYFTDSFCSQITVMLAKKISLESFRKNIKFTNLNDFCKALLIKKLSLLRTAQSEI